jgi:hydrogenase nickel incorporation protein HypA/HybF
MHELSLCLNLVDILESSAREHDFRKVSAVWVELGKHGGADPDALRFGFEVATENTLAEGAHLHIIELPVRAWCFDCDQMIELEETYAACPACGGRNMRVETGQELKIRDLEVE